MARGFNEEERQIIYKSLIAQGRDFFEKSGFQKTSIFEITKKVGIAQGTFYKFFDSKEELYFKILEIEEKKFKKKLIKLDITQTEQPKEVVKETLKEMIRTIENNPLIRELYFGNTMEKLIRKLSPELLEEHFQSDSDSLLILVEKLKGAGFIINQDPDIIAGLFRSLFLLTLHEKEIGPDTYDGTIELLIDLIIDGLLKKERI